MFHLILAYYQVAAKEPRTFIKDGVVDFVLRNQTFLVSVTAHT
jgi:hypothetical protein